MSMSIKPEQLPLLPELVKCNIHSDTTDLTGQHRTLCTQIRPISSGPLTAEEIFSSQIRHAVSDTIIRTPRVFLFNPIVNKSYKTDWCGNIMYQIIQNVIFSRFRT